MNKLRNKLQFRFYNIDSGLIDYSPFTHHPLGSLTIDSRTASIGYMEIRFKVEREYASIRSIINGLLHPRIPTETMS